QAPAEPKWGGVRPWVLSTGSQVRPAAPPACDSDEYLAAARDVYQASLTLSPRQKEIAQYWAGGPGTETPPGMNLRTAMEETHQRGLSTMREARVLAYAGAVIADAAIAAWDAKFTYWWDRPVTTIRRLWDPNWTSYIGTPPFPGYVSGHSTFSGGTMALLAGFFPDKAVAFKAMATDAAMSRFYGGIHARYDNETGLDMGYAIASLALARAATDGAT
ncbi:MAG TPA: vanadium-dependent haloperoxidase, partial [Actinomycetota bacterium]|nr:vanadium-dependent haloperoxidase [Actinomycetota bacterium]